MRTRDYECISCGHQHTLDTLLFQPGDHPLCRECHGVLKRAKGPSSRRADAVPRDRAADHVMIVESSANPVHPNLARNGDRQQGDATGSEVCPFDC